MKTLLITGSDGLVGSAFRAIADNFDYKFVFCNRLAGDLTKDGDVKSIYERFRPNYVIHAAARVGGLGGHLPHQGEYFYDNILMNTLMVHYAMKYGVEKFIGFSSVCAFPYDISVLKEDLLQTGEPFPVNAAYGYAKRMLDVQISAYREQYHLKNYCSIIPGNIFGENDYYNLENGHVLPSLIHKIFFAKKNALPLRVWGNGTTEREFVYSKDLARLTMRVLQLEDIPLRLIISGDRPFTIRQIVDLLCEAASFAGEVIWETDKPNGAPNRKTDLSLLKSLVGDLCLTDLKTALFNAYQWFEKNWPNLRR